MLWRKFILRHIMQKCLTNLNLFLSERYYIDQFNLVHMTFDLLKEYFSINNGQLTKNNVSQQVIYLGQKFSPPIRKQVAS